jgi:hypothetical protein
MSAEPPVYLPLAELITRECSRQGLTLQGLATLVEQAARGRVAISRQQVYRWKRGQIPYPDVQRWLAVGLGLPVQQVAAAAELQREQLTAWEEAGRVNRRQLFRAGVAATGAAATSALQARIQELLVTEPAAMERILAAATIDADALTFLEQSAEDAVRDYELLGPSQLLRPALEDFRLIRERLEDGQPVDYERRLCRVAAQRALLISMFRFDDRPSAQRWLRTATAAATAAGDRVLRAWVLVGESFLPTYNGDHQTALAVLQQGEDAAGRNASTVSAMLAALKARAYASLGDAREFTAALRTAEAGFGRTAGQPGFFTFTEAQLAFYRAGSFARLGKPKEAQAAATDALRLYGASPHYMDPALVRFDLASAYVQQREIAEACRIGRQALSIPAEHRTSPIARRASELLAELAPYEGSREVRAFRDFVHDALPAVA